jgi:hypothetical protein
MTKWQAQNGQYGQSQHPSLLALKNQADRYNEIISYSSRQAKGNHEPI